ncbi:MAG: CotH kinase family protein [Prevotellaceae bacterium]|nr:CotH kinase family protein [Prevotellaceae bacterium]
MRKSIFFLLTSFFCLSIQAQTSDLDLFSPKGVGIIRITLDDGKGFWDINGDHKILATLAMENSSSSIYEDYQFYDGKIEIKLRGNSSQGFDQKSFNFNLITVNPTTHDTLDNPHNMLGMPEDEEWALVAAYPDKSRMRVPLAYKLGELINGEWTPRTRYVEVYINNDYQGLYILCERVKRSNNRINVKKLNFESEADHISGGYILELIPNEAGRINREDYVFYLNRDHDPNPDRDARLVFTTKYPKFKNISQAQINWIQQYLNEFEDVLHNDALYKDPANGWRKYLDENSVINWLLVNELAKNVDARMYASVFLYKDRNGKLKMGPLWDFDIAFGNINYWQESLQINNIYMNTGVWFNRFFADENFSAKFRQRYEEVKPAFDRIPEIIRKNADQLVASGAIDRNFQKWNYLGSYVWPNQYPYPQTYEGEITGLNDWIRAHNSWMNVNMLTTQQEACEKLQSEKIPVWVYNIDRHRAEIAPDTIKTVPGYDKYIWNDGAEQNSSTYSITGSGEYYVKVKKGNCWSTVSDTIVFGTTPPATIQNIGNESLNIYTDDENNLIISANGKEYLVGIFDILGKKQAQFALHEQHTLPLSKGIYVIIAESKRERIIRKVLAR